MTTAPIIFSRQNIDGQTVVHRHSTHEGIMADYTHHVAFTRSVVRFVSSCAPIERHLLAGKPLTDNERDLIYNTVLILHAALEVWQRKNAIPVSQPPRSDH